MVAQVETGVLDAVLRRYLNARGAMVYQCKQLQLIPLLLALFGLFFAWYGSGA